jgi:hypothetical protein
MPILYNALKKKVLQADFFAIKINLQLPLKSLTIAQHQ